MRENDAQRPDLRRIKFLAAPPFVMAMTSMLQRGARSARIVIAVAVCAFALADPEWLALAARGAPVLRGESTPRSAVKRALMPAAKAPAQPAPLPSGKDGKAGKARTPSDASRPARGALVAPPLAASSRTIPTEPSSALPAGTSISTMAGPTAVGDPSSTTLLLPIAPQRFCVTAGAVSLAGPHLLNVNVGGMRGVVAGDQSRVAELAFVYRGPSAKAAPLANGEVRRQLGLKLRARNTCNVVYVMWHVDPTPGIYVSVKSNPGKSTHAECGANGYINLPGPARQIALAPAIGTRHTLRAELSGSVLRVLADGVPAWAGALPAAAFAFDGPVGVRSDNGSFDFDLRVPGGTKAATSCAGVEKSAD